MSYKRRAFTCGLIFFIANTLHFAALPMLLDGFAGHTDFEPQLSVSQRALSMAGVLSLPLVLVQLPLALLMIPFRDAIGGAPAFVSAFFVAFPSALFYAWLLPLLCRAWRAVSVASLPEDLQAVRHKLRRPEQP